MPVFMPNPANPNPLSTSLPLAGEYLTWDQIYMRSYSVQMYGGDGTVQVIGNSSLITSGFYMQGAGANLFNNGAMTLQNSQLEVDGGLVGHGSVTATQSSTITVQSSKAVTDTWIDPMSLSKQQLALLYGAPPELVSLNASTLNITGSNYTGPVIMDGSSTVNIWGPYVLGAGQNFGIYSTTPQLGTVLIGGPTTISGGTMQINANLEQTNNATINIMNNGRLILGGLTDPRISSGGSEIAITSGTLEFARSMGFIRSPETSSEQFAEPLAFAGKSGAVQFDGFDRLMIGIMPQMNEIAVFSGGQRIADFHLAPASHAYSARDFSVHGNELIYHHVG